MAPPGTWLPVPNCGPGTMSAHLGLILHVQEGNGGLQDWFSNPASKASSNWWVSKTGAIECYVDPSGPVAWAQGAGNATYNSVETEGFTTEALTPAQIAGVAEIYSWGQATYGWPLTLAEAPGEGGLGTHGMGGLAWGNHPGCPGAIRAAQRQAILDATGPPPNYQEDEEMAVIESGGQRHVFGVVGNSAYHWWQQIDFGPGQPVDFTWHSEKLPT